MMGDSTGLARDVSLWNRAIKSARREVFEILMDHYEGWTRNPGADDSGAMALGNALFLVFPEYRDEARARADAIGRICNAPAPKYATPCNTLDESEP